MDETCTTTCARCAHQFIVTDGDLDAEVAAHQGLCFVVGDRVRWEFLGNVVDGRLTWRILATSSSFHGATGVGYERKYGTAHPAMVSHLTGPTAAESMKQSWDAFDAAYPRRPPQVGDRIRWWPRVTYMGTPSADAEWLDGSVISLLDGRLIMEVTARSGSNATNVYRCYTLPLTLVRCVWGAEDGDTIPVDPLTVLYDGSRLGTLIEGDEFDRRETSSHWRTRAMTSAQRDAVSAHWSAELRAKLKASKERERCQVVLDDDEMTIANCADVKDAD